MAFFIIKRYQWICHIILFVKLSRKLLFTAQIFIIRYLFYLIKPLSSNCLGPKIFKGRLHCTLVEVTSSFTKIKVWCRTDSFSLYQKWWNKSSNLCYIIVFSYNVLFTKWSTHHICGMCGHKQTVCQFCSTFVTFFFN